MDDRSWNIVLANCRDIGRRIAAQQKEINCKAVANCPETGANNEQIGIIKEICNHLEVALKNACTRKISRPARPRGHQDIKS